MTGITPLRLIQLLAEAVNKNPGLANQPVCLWLPDAQDTVEVTRCWPDHTSEAILIGVKGS
jgi:hypothetical protein